MARSTEDDEPKDYGPQNPCPHCGAETEMGYGLAGGGCGVYLWCEACQDVVNKTQDEE